MRSDLESNKARDLDIRNAHLGVNRIALTGDVVLPEDAPVLNYFDANGADRIITLPALERGLFYIIFNVGSANLLTIKTATGSTLVQLTTVEGAQFYCSGREWRFLVGIASGTITTTLTSVDGSVDITVVDPVTVDLGVNEAGVNHDALLNFVANKHIDHTAVTLTAGTGLSGGGDISASRTFDLDLSDLVADTPVLADTFAFYDVSGLDTNKATLSVLNGILDHDALFGFVANEHIDHTTVSITAGTGLTGGGTIAATRTLSLDVNGLVVDSPTNADFLVFYDVTGADHNKATISSIFNAMVPGADTNIIFNDAGTFGADAGLVYDKATDTLGLTVSGSKISFNSGDVLITHSANALAFTGASSGYSLDALLSVNVAGNTARFVNATDAASSQVARFEGDRATITASDEAYLSLMLSNSAGTQTEFARLSWIGTTVTAASEAGALDFGVITAGVMVDHIRLNTTTFRPITNDSHALGASGNSWSDLFLASGAVINFNAGDVTITHAANSLAFGGATSGYTFDAAPLPSANDAAALGASGTAWSDLFLASGAVINFNAGNITLTHSAGDLALAGGTLTLPNTGLHLLDTNASHDLIVKPGSDLTADRTLTITTGDADRTLTISSSATISSETQLGAIVVVIDGGGSTITTGVKGDVEIPFGCTINRVTMLADQSGSIVVDVWKDTYANYPPTVADTIVASAKPTITTATKSQDTTLTGWTTSITAGDTLRFNVDSVTTITRVTLIFKVTKT